MTLGGSPLSNTFQRTIYRPGSCTRREAPGTITHTGAAGANRVAFDGQTKAPVWLAPGDYTVVITATANGLSASSKPLHFTMALR
jgi:hypothetical protein